MNIAVIGTGYVGLVTGACFSSFNNKVYCIDIDKKKISSLKKGIVTIYEPKLQDLVKKNIKTGHLIFTSDLKDALRVCDICFIAVGTPMNKDGGADLKYVLEVAKNIGKYMQKHIYVIDKSTVPVGTSKSVKNIINKELIKRKSKLTFDVISNPEFLKEGTAILDCLEPDRIIVGCDNINSKKIMEKIYAPINKNKNLIIFMDILSAEMCKYAANAMLANKISFMNEMANICCRVGADINKVRLGIGSDKRIGFNYLYPGCGYGGSCLPKDINSLINTCNENKYDAKLIKAINYINNNQTHILSKMVLSRFGKNLKNKVFAIWGLSFKPNTDDMRDAPSITIIKDLIKLGAKIQAYDPRAMTVAKKIFDNNKQIKYSSNKEDALNNAYALILITEWSEFRKPNFKIIKNKLKKPVIFDGRNQYDKNDLDKLGFEYYQIGVNQ